MSRTTDWGKPPDPSDDSPQADWERTLTPEQLAAHRKHVDAMLRGIADVGEITPGIQVLIRHILPAEEKK